MRLRSSPALRSFTLILALVSMPAVAAAQSSSSFAEGLFTEGKALMQAGDYEAACPKLRESDRLEPALGTKLNLASCEAGRGRVATAAALFREVAQRLPDRDPRVPWARSQAEALSARIPHLVLTLDTGAPASSTVRIGDLVLESSAFGTRLPIDPGTHELIVEAPGRQAGKYKVTLAAGGTETLVVSPGEPLAESPLAAPAASPLSTASAKPAPLDVAPRAAHSSRRTWAWVAGGVGLVGVAAGATFGIATLSKKSAGDEACPTPDSCTKEGEDALADARKYRTISNVGWAVALVGVGVGAVLYFTSDSSPQSGGVALGMHALPAGAAASLMKRF